MALITFTMSGDPSPSETVEIASAMERGGADMIELGLCFSDPIADGPVIQAASDRAMRTGISQEDYFAVAGEIHNLVSVPLISLTYYNMVLRYGVSRFMRSCVRSGISGLVVPDLPVDEAGEVIEASRRHGVDTVFLAAPTSSDDRIGRIARSSSGFVYLVSVLGVTGTRRKIPEVGELIHKIKRHDVPVAVGFGISSQAHVSGLKRMGADGAIVGSAIVRLVAGNQNKTSSVPGKIEKLVRHLKRAT